ncbi:hypothetical protein ACLBYG_24740 [Methylobacterium sp. D53M]
MASTRRAALGAILSAPLASVPAAAAMGSDEARFLASAPRIVALLEEYDRLWAISAPLYELYSEASNALRSGGFEDRHETPEWFAYIESRRGADEIDNALNELFLSFRGIRFRSPEAILLRHRYALTFEWEEDQAAADVRAYWDAQTCA